jgi:hypothetical protein
VLVALQANVKMATREGSWRVKEGRERCFRSCKGLSVQLPIHLETCLEVVEPEMKDRSAACADARTCASVKLGGTEICQVSAPMQRSTTEGVAAEEEAVRDIPPFSDGFNLN